MAAGLIIACWAEKCILAELMQKRDSKIRWRAVLPAVLGLYCLAIFLVLDFVYSGFLHDEGRSPRIAHPVYHHGLEPNFDGYEHWGDHRFKVYTNSMGFRDAAVRDVPASSSMR